MTLVIPRAAALVWLVPLFGACTGKPGLAVSAGDSGTAPASAYDECAPAGAHDAATFAFTATCTLPADDAGAMTSCQQWSESPDGDWTPFLETCSKANGVIGTTPCPDAGMLGECVMAATCTSQTVVFEYQASGVAAARAACDASPGARFSP